MADLLADLGPEQATSHTTSQNSLICLAFPLCRTAYKWAGSSLAEWCQYNSSQTALSQNSDSVSSAMCLSRVHYSPQIHFFPLTSLQYSDAKLTLSLCGKIHWNYQFISTWTISLIQRCTRYSYPTLSSFVHYNFLSYKYHTICLFIIALSNLT